MFFFSGHAVEKITPMANLFDRLVPGYGFPLSCPSRPHPLERMLQPEGAVKGVRARLSLGAQRPDVLAGRTGVQVRFLDQVSFRRVVVGVGMVRVARQPNELSVHNGSLDPASPVAHEAHASDDFHILAHRIGL